MPLSWRIHLIRFSHGGAAASRSGAEGILQARSRDCAYLGVFVRKNGCLLLRLIRPRRLQRRVMQLLPLVRRRLALRRGQRRRGGGWGRRSCSGPSRLSHPRNLSRRWPRACLQADRHRARQLLQRSRRRVWTTFAPAAIFIVVGFHEIMERQSATPDPADP